jgi:putative hydrolase of the HAD superfamily
VILSIVAEFARRLHEKEAQSVGRSLQPLPFPSNMDMIYDVKVMVFDVYGTLFNYWRPEFSQESTKQKALLDAFAKTISYFGLSPYLTDMTPESPPEITLSDLYHGLISLKRDLLLEKKNEFPEIKIEDAWYAILLMLKRHGFSFNKNDYGSDKEFARCIAYCYNFYVFSRGLYPGVADSLQALKQMNITLGIVSNAQFYTPIDLTLFLRDQTNGEIDDRNELFENDLVFFSYEYAVAKPSQFLFRKLFDALYEFHVLPSQTVFVGNDLIADMKPAQEAGMRTAFFTGDHQSAFIHDCADKVVPDIVFSTWNELPQKISFHEKTYVKES